MSIDQAVFDACCGQRIPGVACAPPVNACQLCPSSPTYWRNQPPTPAPATEAPTAVLPTRSGGLDWSGHKAGDRRPCRLCGDPAFTRDADGRPCHKTCAEQAGEQPTSAGPALRLIEGGKR